MRIQYFVGPVQDRHTGGIIYHAELMHFLAKENEIVHEVDISRVNRGNMLFANYWCWRKIQQCRADVIVEESHYAICLLLANWLVRKRYSRIVTFVQSVPEEYNRWSAIRQALRRTVMNIFLSSCDLIVANSHYTRNQIISRYSVSAEKVIVIYPARQKLNGEEAPKIPSGAGVKRLLSVANIYPKKGQRYLVEAIRLLNQSDCCLTLVGEVKDPAYYRNLLEFISRYGLGERIRLAGFLQGEALAAEYRAADIFVHPCLGEEYGMVVAEAMGWGLPVVASRVGGIPEVMGDNGSVGFLVHPADPPGLIEALQRLITDSHLRVKMGEAARKRAVELPTWEEVCGEFWQALLLINKQRSGMLPERNLSPGARLLIRLSRIFPKRPVPPRSDDPLELADPSDRGTSPAYRIAQTAAGRERVKEYKKFFSMIEACVLDFGCGMGGCSIAYQEVASHVIGLDLRLPLLTDAHKAVCSGEFGERNVNFVLGNGRALPFSDARIGIIISNATLEHVQAPGIILNELWRILKADGHLAFDFPSWLSPWASHKQELIPIPWVHLVCPERMTSAAFNYLLAQRQKTLLDDTKRIGIAALDSPFHLNHLTVGRLLTVLKGLPDCQIVRMRLVSGSWIGQMLIYLPVLGELFADQVSVVLKKCKGARVNRGAVYRCTLREFCRDTTRVIGKLGEAVGISI